MTAAGPGSGPQRAPVEDGGDPPCWAGLVDDHRDQADAPPDLSTPTEIHHLVTAFYREIVFDELLEPVFGEIAEVDWAEHIPKLIDYWCWILLGKGPYRGAVTQAHRHLHEQAPIRSEHCDRWFSLWVSSIDGGWSGPHAEAAKRHAQVLMAGMAKRLFGFEWAPPAGTWAIDAPGRADPPGSTVVEG